MRKWLSVVLCAVMLVSLSSCGMDWTYCRGMNYISKGDYAAAYETLQAATHPNAAKELEKFIYVPTTHTYTSLSRDVTTKFTYNEMGYPIRIETIMDDATQVQTYVYDGTVKKEYRDTYTYVGGTLTEVYIYTEWGDVVDYAYYSDERLMAEHHAEYDEKNRLVKYTEQGDGYNNWEEYTYDAKGRKLTWEGSHQGIDFVAVFSYAEDGTYVENREDDYGDEKWRTQISYDKKGQIVRSHSVLVGSADTDDTRLDEYTYDKAGNEIYHYSKWGTTVETTTSEYNDRNDLVSAKTLDQNGEIVKWVRCTYDEDGRTLTYERTSDGISWRKDTYIYDEEGNLLSEYYYNPETDSIRDVTYTYNEDGTLKMSEQRGSNGSVLTAYGYDELGNRVQSLTQQGLEQAGATATYQWFYYPHGVPQVLAAAIDQLQWD